MDRIAFTCLLLLTGANALNLNYLDPTKLQTKTSPETQRIAALKIIQRYAKYYVTVEIDPLLFRDNKDVFVLKTAYRHLNIRASTGVAAVWGFNYYLKKYCKSQIAWQVSRVVIPTFFPEVDEVVVANDRFRYYQNVCTVSYSFVWWKVPEWQDHVAWMALNGLNLVLAPVAQEAAWAKVYKKIGMTDDEIDQHFTGPAFLSWLRMGNVHGWGGPLLKSWNDVQVNIQSTIVNSLLELGIVPVFPAFNGHVPKALARIYPDVTFHSVDKWNKFDDDYCCGLFLDPNTTLFKDIGKSFLSEVTAGSEYGHIYTADPFNEVKIQDFSTSLATETAKAIYATMSEFDNEAVWLVQNWMFVSAPLNWPISRVQSFLTSVPNGRMLVLDLQAEQWPQYNLYDMYYGQPFIWCMLHNFGGTLGMFGNVITINKDVYEARSRINSTMIGIGLTPEGINQNYVVYDIMLESAWRKGPIPDLEAWTADYAERRYGCNLTASAWKYLLKSVYSFDGLNMMRGKYVITRRPSFKISPWAWYKGHDLFEALRRLLASDGQQSCTSSGYYYDVVDVTRQALQYRAEQLYLNLQRDRLSTTWVFNASITQYLDVMHDIERILATNVHFQAWNWFNKANSFGRTAIESYTYLLNSRNQITLWGPNGEISDYACKQWFELFQYYYTPRWSAFLNAALDAKLRNERFDEKSTQMMIKDVVETKFLTVDIEFRQNYEKTLNLALELLVKWAHVPDLEDLPRRVVKVKPGRRTTLPDVDFSKEDDNEPTLVMLSSQATTPLL